MEHQINIKTKDGYRIYGVLTVPKKKTEKLVVFVHGLTGHKNEHIFYNAAHLFSKEGIATYRFDLYSGEKNSRTLLKSAHSTHARDLDTVISYFEKTFSKIYIVGHSFGGPTILLSHKIHSPKVAGIILWDPSRGTDWWEKELIYDKRLDAYILEWGVRYVIGKKMYREWMDFDGIKLIKNIHKPIKIISAEKGILVKGCKEYLEHANTPKQLVIIKNAGHTFDEEGAEDALFKETLDWVRKY